MLTAAVNRSTDVVKGRGTPTGQSARSDREFFSLRSPALSWAGGLAVTVGAAATVALSGSGTTRSVAIVAAVMTLVWAAVRWALLDVVASRRTTLGHANIRGAWALGSLAWLIGVTPELRALAWLVSGVVTWRVLERHGATRRQSLASVGIAWGAQALVVLGSWLATNAVIALLATRG